MLEITAVFIMLWDFGKMPKKEKKKRPQSLLGYINSVVKDTI
jgi:hypothetical protein